MQPQVLLPLLAFSYFSLEIIPANIGRFMDGENEEEEKLKVINNV